MNIVSELKREFKKIRWQKKEKRETRNTLSRGPPRVLFDLPIILCGITYLPANVM